jgi:hypothetical protein
LPHGRQHRGVGEVRLRPFRSTPNQQTCVPADASGHRGPTQLDSLDTWSPREGHDHTEAPLTDCYRRWRAVVVRARRASGAGAAQVPGRRASSGDNRPQGGRGDGPLRVLRHPCAAVDGGVRRHAWFLLRCAPRRGRLLMR